MFPFFAHVRRFTGSYGLACLSILVVSLFVGTAAGQNKTREKPKVPAPNNPWEDRDNMEQVNQVLEEFRKNAIRDFGDLPHAPNVKKTVRAMEDAATGTTAAIIIAFAFVALLLGLFICRRLVPGAHTKRSALDDPYLRAYLAGLETNKAPAKTEQVKVIADRLPKIAPPSTSIKLKEKKALPE